MTDAEKIAALSKALDHAKNVFLLLAQYDAQDMTTAQAIASREARRIAEQMTEINPAL